MKLPISIHATNNNDVLRYIQQIWDQLRKLSDQGVDGFNIAKSLAGDGIGFSGDQDPTKPPQLINLLIPQPNPNPNPQPPNQPPPKPFFYPPDTRPYSAGIRVSRKTGGVIDENSVDPPIGIEMLVDAAQSSGKICIVDSKDIQNPKRQLIELNPDDSTSEEPGGEIKTPYGAYTIDTGGAFDVIVKRNAVEGLRLDGTGLLASKGVRFATGITGHHITGAVENAALSIAGNILLDLSGKVAGAGTAEIQLSDSQVDIRGRIYFFSDMWNVGSKSAHITHANAADGRIYTFPDATGTVALTSDLESYQPLDADLTAIAALTTTAHGRGLLDDADAAASRASIGAAAALSGTQNRLAKFATTTTIGDSLFSDDGSATAVLAGATAPRFELKEGVTLRTVLRTDAAGNAALESTGTGGIDLNYAGGSGGTTIWNGAAVQLARFKNGVGLRIGTGDPTVPLDVSGKILTDNQLESTIATGTAPLVVASTTKVVNLNADLLDDISLLALQEQKDGVFRILSATDETKKIAFSASGITTGTVRTLTAPNADGTIALTSDLESYQPLDADLTAIAGLVSAADKGIQFTGAGTAAVYDLTTAGKALLDDATAAAQRTTLGLVAIAASGSAADLSTGIIPDARMPNLTGIVTTVEGAVATTLVTDATLTQVDNILSASKPKGFMDGGRLKYNTAAIVDIEACVCRDSTDALDLTLAAVSPNITTQAASGTSGIDQAAITATATTHGTATFEPSASLWTETAFTTIVRTGTGTIAGAGTTITGTGTKFLSEIAINDVIRSNAQGASRVTAIASDTSLTIQGAFAADAGGLAFTIYENLTIQPDTAQANDKMRVNSITHAGTSVICSTTAMTSNGAGKTIRVGVELGSNAAVQGSWFFPFVVKTAGGTIAVLSTQRTTPFLTNTGFRLVGAVYNDSSGNIESFRCEFMGSARWFYQVRVDYVSDGTQTAYSRFEWDPSVPAIAEHLIITIYVYGTSAKADGSAPEVSISFDGINNTINARTGQVDNTEHGAEIGYNQLMPRDRDGGRASYYRISAAATGTYIGRAGWVFTP